ncbi:hypothetical protein LZ32DRAFT_610659 [Colletotrichum eremochloae]|nr:hypothetical protein LZ32DRAFT_610659 [Colletotrichum eremochloae]
MSLARQTRDTGRVQCALPVWVMCYMLRAALFLAARVHAIRIVKAWLEIPKAINHMD